ncbi:MAG: hypothetical protein ABRQ37_14120 [Candidatus Eremiobacterota bacterium]
MQIERTGDYRFYSSNITNVNVSQNTTKIIKDKEEDKQNVDKKGDKSQEQPREKTPAIDTKDKTDLSMDAQAENKVQNIQDSDVDNKVNDVKKSIDEVTQPGGKAEENQKSAGAASMGGGQGVRQVQGVQQGGQQGKISEIGGNMASKVDGIKQGGQTGSVNELTGNVSAIKENLQGKNVSKANDMDEKVNALKESLNKHAGTEKTKDIKDGAEDKSVKEQNKAGDKDKLHEADKSKETDKTKEAARGTDDKKVNNTKENEPAKVTKPENAQINQGKGNEEIKGEKKGIDETDPQQEQQKIQMMMEEIHLRGITNINRAAEEAGFSINQVNDENIGEISKVARRDMQQLLKPDQIYGIPEHNERIGQKVEDGVKKKLEEFLGRGGNEDELKEKGMGKE